MKRASIALSLVAVLALNGCGETTASRSATGGLAGAAGGAAIGAIAGNAGLGAAIGSRRRVGGGDTSMISSKRVT